MRHSQYTAFFRQLAEQHADILHSSQDCRFLRVVLSSDPLQRIMDAREFYDGMRDKLSPGYCMILQSYEVDYADSMGDQKTRECHGAFIILHKVEAGDFDGLEQVLDKTEEIGEDIMGATVHLINQDFTLPKKFMTFNGISNERVGPVGENYHGTKFSFFFTQGANPSLRFKQDKFTAQE